MGSAKGRERKKEGKIIKKAQLHEGISVYTISSSVNFIVHTWVSLGSVHALSALRLHRPITAEEELPAQWGEEPVQTVRDGLGV